MTAVEIVGLSLMILGIVLIIVEMFIPGFGFPGIGGSVSLIVGICLKARSLEEGLTLGLFSLIGLGTALAVVMIFFRSKKVRSPIKLEETMPSDVKFLDVKDMEYLIGKCGVTVTDLRPAGKADIDGVSFDVRSGGAFIPQKSPIVIEKVQGGSLIVKEKKM